MALGQRITASDTDGSSPENLTGLIETDADIQAGDSGGPLYNASGSIIGMDTAASTSNGSSATAQSYAIPIASALSVATQIENGTSSATVHIGPTAFLGVEIASTSSGAGATVGGVLASGPAAGAGLVAGDVITSLGGQTVSSPTVLSALMAGHHPGDVVALVWTDAAGTSHHANVTLATGPAQ